MKWNLMLGTMVAVGLLATTEVRAQESAAAGTPALQNDGASNPSGDGSQPNAVANAAPAYGTYVEDPATVDADGVPIANPNPMSNFLNRSRPLDTPEAPLPLLDDPRTEVSASGQTK